MLLRLGDNNPYAMAQMAQTFEVGPSIFASNKSRPLAMQAS
jgi:hypothetical protein